MNNNFLLLAPEFIVTGLAFVVLTLDLFLPERRKWALPFVAVAGLAVALVVSLATLIRWHHGTHAPLPADSGAGRNTLFLSNNWKRKWLERTRESVGKV